MVAPKGGADRPAMRRRRGSPDAATIERTVGAPARHHLQQSYQYLTDDHGTQPHNLPHNLPAERPRRTRAIMRDPGS
jgi:hypothetical protein